MSKTLKDIEPNIKSQSATVNIITSADTNITLEAFVDNGDSATANIKKPVNPWWRMYPVNSAGAFLIWKEKGKNGQPDLIHIQQFSSHSSSPYARPLIFTPLSFVARSQTLNIPSVPSGSTINALHASNASNAPSKLGSATELLSPSGSRRQKLPDSSPHQGHSLKSPSGQNNASSKLGNETHKLGTAAQILSPSGSKRQRITGTASPNQNHALQSPNSQNLEGLFDITTPRGSKFSTERSHTVTGHDGVQRKLCFASPPRPPDAGERLHKKYGIKPNNHPETSLTSKIAATSSTMTKAQASSTVQSLKTDQSLQAEDLANLSEKENRPVYDSPADSTTHKRKRGLVAEFNFQESLELSRQYTEKGGVEIPLHNLCKRKRTAAKTTVGYPAQDGLGAQVKLHQAELYKAKLEAETQSQKYNQDHEQNQEQKQKQSQDQKQKQKQDQKYNQDQKNKQDAALKIDPSAKKNADDTSLQTDNSEKNSEDENITREQIKILLQQKKELYDKNTLKIMENLLEFSMEHLHLLAHSLSPETYNPDTLLNLGIAGSWINTYMMVLEMVAKYFLKKFNQEQNNHEFVSITPKFIMMPNSPLIKEISYEVLLKANNQSVKLHYKINALALPDRSNWPSHTDAEHVKRIVEALLNSSPPTRSYTFSMG